MIQIRLSQARLSSTVRPEREKFMSSKATEAVTMAAIVEVGLSGEIRSITHMEQRLSEVKRLGFTQCMVPAHKVKDLKAPVGLELLPVANISRALQLLARGQ